MILLLQETSGGIAQQDEELPILSQENSLEESVTSSSPQAKFLEDNVFSTTKDSLGTTAISNAYPQEQLPEKTAISDGESPEKTDIPLTDESLGDIASTIQVINIIMANTLALGSMHN